MINSSPTLKQQFRLGSVSLNIGLSQDLPLNIISGENIWTLRSIYNSCLDKQIKMNHIYAGWSKMLFYSALASWNMIWTWTIQNKQILSEYCSYSLFQMITSNSN